MGKKLCKKDIDDMKKISILFSTISEESKAMGIVYLSALRDKEIADNKEKKDLQEV